MNEGTTMEIWREAAKRLSPVAYEEAAQQARLLLCFVLGAEASRWIEYLERRWTLEECMQLEMLLERRLKGEPLQYILGSWGFMGLEFAVAADALIPRPETETLCERALELAKEKNYRTALDLCCGSGCIGVSLARLGKLKVTSTDISDACLNLTRENAKLNEVALETIQSDLFMKIEGRYDLIVSNPPYLSAADMEQLQPELVWEPSLALYGGEDGLDFYRRIALAYETHLNPGGTLLLEVGQGQAQAVSALFYHPVRVIKDLTGIERVIEVHV